MEEFDFPTDIRDRNYRVFSDVLENDEEVLFHGTSREGFEAICREGFKAKKDLPSVSFARQSSLSLGYACDPEENGVVIAVRFNNQSGVRHEISIVYLDDFSNQPEIVGYCNIPSAYKHI